MIIGVYGHQDSGKTTLVEELIKGLSKQGFSVSSVKHAPHLEEVDTMGKDTWRHSSAGSDPVVLEATGGTVLIKKPGLSLDDAVGIVQREFCPDVLLVEGHKDGDFPKIALGDIEPTEGTVLVNPGIDKALELIEKEVVHERVMRQLPKLDCGRCGSSCSDLARDIIDGVKNLDDCPERPAGGVEIIVGGQRLPVGAFVAEITERTIRGFLSSLKGYSNGMEVEIRICRPTEEMEGARSDG